MSRCFCPDVKNEDDLIKMLKQGYWDKSIFEYLIEIMSEQENKLLPYEPVELFEMQANLSDNNELLCFTFYDASNSGICEGWKYTMNKKQRELFDSFVTRIQEIYQSLLKLVA